jgi:hypothetical protein
MKKLKYIMIFLIVSLSVSSCLKEDFVPDPSVKSLTMYMLDVNQRDSLVTEISKGITVKFVIETEAEVCSVWPGGVRKIMKKKGTTIDSLDMFQHPVLVNSDCYIDYGLVGARGYKGTQTDEGWYVSYKYPQSGSFDLTIVLTNHGYQNPDYTQVVIPYGKIAVK